MRFLFAIFFMLICLLPACKPVGDPDLTESHLSACSHPEKVPIQKLNVYDLSGYADEGGGDPYKLFDENAYVDPRYEKPGENYIPTTNCQPTKQPAIYFPIKKGSRIVVDLLTSYRLSEIYLYDRSLSSDSVWIYTGNMNHWSLKCALETKSEPGAWGWRRFTLDDSARYVMFRFNSYQTKITEAVLYGCSIGILPETPRDPKTGNHFTSRTMREFLGVNYIMETDPKWLRPFHSSRIYNFALDYDNDTSSKYPGVKYNMLHYGFWNQEKKEYYFNIDDLKKINNGNIWYSIRGVPAWMNNKGFTERDRPVTFIDMDPEDPKSYARHANMMWHLAAFFGNTKVDTNLLSLSHEPRQSGRGVMSVYENGNEEDAWWEGKRYCSPMEYFAQSSADYDGHESVLGKKCGIENADSTSLLLMSGMVGLDTNRLRVLKFLSTTLRKDQQFPWKGGIQYHYYCNRNEKGISPEDDSLRMKLSKVSAATYSIQPGVPCILGENGYDKSRASRQSVPLVGGYNAAQSQGIMILRSINATAFSGFDAYILYWLKDGNDENDPRVYLTSGILRLMPDGKTRPYPGWFYINTFEQRLSDFSPDSIISEKGNVWIYRYRNRFRPDSVSYFVYCPTHNGSSAKDFEMHVGNIIGNALEVDFADNEPSGRPMINKNGELTLTVEEKPKLIFVREKPSH
ncbi:MAG: hypothetical protein C5B59_13860 [Bacteroidetes bacterium]|nr:MAG: hypothetical protein C5B59_13860 [Bacteroidota bacterium]